MRKIKFRGLAITDMSGKKFEPKMVYGNVFNTESGDYARIATFKNVRGEMFTYNVKPESVAMFIGYDKNGAEIYSDDKIRVYDYSRYCLAGTGIEEAEDFFKISDVGKTFDNVELLEESEENGNDI